MSQAIVRRRLFDDEPYEDSNSGKSRRTSKTAEELRELGLIRASCIISIKLNESLKKMAGWQGKNTDDLIGEIVSECSDKVMHWEASLVVESLRERYGDEWLELLKTVSDKS